METYFSKYKYYFLLQLLSYRIKLFTLVYIMNLLTFTIILTFFLPNINDNWFLVYILNYGALVD